MNRMSSPKIGGFGEWLAFRANWPKDIRLLTGFVMGLLWVGHRFIIGRLAGCGCVGNHGKEELKVSLAQI